MESEILDIKSILEDLGYKLQDSGPDFWMTKSLDRGFHKGSNLSISKKTGVVLDFSGGSKYTIEEFIKLNNGTIDFDKINFIQNDNWSEQIILPKTFDKSILDNLIKDYSYWENRGIKKSILEEFGGGLAGELFPKFNKDHYLTPIFNQKQEIEGFSARYTGSNPKIKKQKILGVKKKFKFPLFLNKQDIIESRTVYLVEGMADLYTMFTCGFRNTLCCFGLNLSQILLSCIVSLNPQNIIICENNDPVNEHGNRPGQEGALKMKKYLLNFFDEKVVKIKNPAPYKDLNEALNESGPDFIAGLLREKSI